MHPTRRAALHTLFAAALSASVVGLAPAASARQTQNPNAVKVLGEMGKATLITEGRGPRVIYIFFDANCPYCHQLYTDLRPSIGKDGLEVRWVPVAVLTPSSVTKGAAILQASDRLKAFHENEAGYGKGPTGQGGGIAPAARVLAATSAILNANNALLDATKSPGVPTMLYRDQQGDAMLVVGPPDAQQLQDILASVK